MLERKITGKQNSSLKESTLMSIKSIQHVLKAEKQQKLNVKICFYKIIR